MDILIEEFFNISDKDINILIDSFQKINIDEDISYSSYL